MLNICVQRHQLLATQSAEQKLNGITESGCGTHASIRGTLWFPNITQVPCTEYDNAAMIPGGYDVLHASRSKETFFNTWFSVTIDNVSSQLRMTEPDLRSDVLPLSPFTLTVAPSSLPLARAWSEKHSILAFLTRRQEVIPGR